MGVTRGTARRHHLGDAGTRPADPGRVGGIHARARGTFTRQYPYGFVNVWHLGYAQVTINIVAILIGALLFMALFAGADWLIRKACLNRIDT